MVWVSLKHLSPADLRGVRITSLTTWGRKLENVNANDTISIRKDLKWLADQSRKVIVPGSIFLCPRGKSLFCRSVVGILLSFRRNANGFGQKFSLFLCPCMSLLFLVCSHRKNLLLPRFWDAHLLFQIRSTSTRPPRAVRPQSMGANAVWVFFLGTFELKMPGLDSPKRNSTGNLLIQLWGASSV